MNYNTKGMKIIEIEGMTCLVKRKGLMLSPSDYEIMKEKSEDQIQDFMIKHNLSKINFFRDTEQFKGVIKQIQKENEELIYSKKEIFFNQKIQNDIAIINFLNENQIDKHVFIENLINFYSDIEIKQIKKLNIVKDLQEIV